MKNVLLPVTAGLIFFASCKERGPGINFEQGTVGDTTFMAAPETPEPKRILIEEYTGVTCPNCPQGHDVISGIQTRYPDRVIAIGYHPKGQGQATPKTGVSRYDFRTDEGTQLANTFNSIPFLPSGVVDRTKSGSEYLVGRNTWNGTADSRLLMTSPVNVRLNVTYGETTREAIIRVHAAFTSAVNKKVLLHMAVVENNIIDFQEYPTQAQTDTNYTHKHIFRDFITPVPGAAMIDSVSTKMPGRVFESTVTYRVSDTWKAENCKVVVFITDGESGDIEVLQVAEAAIKQ